MPSSTGRVPATRVPTIIVHGGAGADLSDAPDELRHGVRAAALAGWQVLASGGAALDAVESAVRVLEDHPRFNAGRGSVLTADGTVEMDASIMEGDRLECGAVAAVARIANPITLARRILETHRHVLLAGPGAVEFARSSGIAECAAESLVTDRQRRRHVQRSARGAAADGGTVNPAADGGTVSPAADGGTVGAVALDRHGTVAAATSTGGTASKIPGRVGDSALIGCGTFADSSMGGVSCTGD